MSEMTSGLVERIEAATGPDRELDVEIALSLGIVTEREGNTFYGHRDYGTMVLEHDYYDYAGGPPELPHYTTSIDAAMTLVPEGWMRIFGDDPDSGKAVAGLYKGSEGDAKSIAETIPLALCAAALRARAPLPAPPAKDTI